MSKTIGRRDAIFLLGAGIASAASDTGPLIAHIAGITDITARISIGKAGAAIPQNGSMLPVVLSKTGKPIRNLNRTQHIDAGRLKITLRPEPLELDIQDADGRVVQRLGIDINTGAVTFITSKGPVLGLGEGGAQFDRRGSFDEMKNGQIGRAQRTTGARVPVPWVVGSDGWAIFFHQPVAAKFDFTNKDEGRFLAGNPPSHTPLDLFITVAREPARIMQEYALLTGFPGMPPLWSFGYQQSHRTLASRDEVLGIAKTFREKKLPCDVLIYLGTGFCPSGWNTGHGSFTFNPKVFPDPAQMIHELHEEHFRIVLHTVFRDPVLRGSAKDVCDTPGNDEEAGCYWQMHRKVFDLGVDGWWADEGDQLNAKSRLCRNRMYYEGPLLDRRNVRPYALHRNGYAGTQRFGAFLWSGDIASTWETLRLQLPVAINTGLSGLPFWGTDTGGFVPTKELTAELFVRWFQFSAFCPLFRGHGRTWKLRLPWQWNTGDLGPEELSGKRAADPDKSELHNAAVEPICRKYLDLRYRLMPYLYSVVREAYETGLPILRALWLHYPEDPLAIVRSDEYLWGSQMLVAPVCEGGAKNRDLYLPKTLWFDFWNESRIEGGREITREVDLATIPLFVRAGAILPLGPVKQYTTEDVSGPAQLCIYPGADGRFVFYEDDGITYNFLRGQFTKLLFEWNDRLHELTITPTHANGTNLREFLIRVVPEKKLHPVTVGPKRLRLRLMS